MKFVVYSCTFIIDTTLCDKFNSDFLRLITSKYICCQISLNYC